MTEFKWQAQYNDGTTLNQIDDDGVKHAFADIDRKRLQAFFLHRTSDSLDGTQIPFFTLIFDENDGQDLVWTRRVYQRLGMNEATVFHIVGKRNKFIAAIADNEQIIVRDKFVDDGLFDEVIQ